jgi:DNA-binding MarR family transcriptional regulator
VRELAGHFKKTGPNMQVILDRLEARGRIKRVRRMARTIELVRCLTYRWALLRWEAMRKQPRRFIVVNKKRVEKRVPKTGARKLSDEEFEKLIRAGAEAQEENNKKETK